jgi:hypothetical protein
MPDLEKGAMANHSLPAWARKKIAEAQKRRWLKIRGTSNQPKRDPQPPRVAKPLRSPLREKLVKNIGRELQDDEARFVLQVQRCFADARVRMFTENDLGLMAGRASDGYWTALDLWREFPPDDFYFWLYVAWELRRRKWKYPQFIAGVTDFQLIEPAMKQWERDQEIEQWNNRFRQFENHAPVSGTDVLELRLTIGVEEARLQWRSEANAGFAELERVRAGNIAEQCEKGTLAIAPNSLPLWSAAYRPWRSESWWFFRYDNAAARPGLNCLLRMPLAPDRVVTSDSQPLRRVAQPLRFDLRAPENVDGDYELALGTADGSSPPKILCALDGRPTLYLTEGALFVGPPAVLDAELRKNIPASALETAAGLEFLHAAGIALPEHLSERIRTVPVRVTISCALKPTYPASPTEDIVLRAAAKAPGMKSERYAPAGWEVERKDNAGENSESAKGVIVVHDRAAQRYFPRAIESLELKWSNDPGEWTLRLTKKTPERFVAWLESLPPEIEVLLDPELATLRDAPVSGNVSLDVDEAGIDWFDLRVALQVSDTTLTPQELKLLLNARGGYVRLEKRGWRRLQFSLTPDDYEQLARLGLDARDFSAEPQRFHTLQLAEDAAKKFLAPERVETIQRRASELKTHVAPPLPAVIRAEMRPYQTEGFHFLAYLASNRFGGVLADDMGLGKTLQALAWLAWLRKTTLHAQPPAPSSSLVVCPKSVMDNWHAEANRFYPDLRVRLWRGEPGAELSAARENCDLLVINYTQLRYLSPEIASAPWLAAILDEAQCIKNPSSQTAQAARALKAEHRLALTGTPIENRLQDLWSVFAFAMPGALGNRTHFLRRFDSKDDPLARRRLAARVRPFLLRRTKAQVEKDLPDRVEEDLLCEMEGEQKNLYHAELKRARQLLLGLKTDKQLNQGRFHVLTSLLRLRQICCHPALVDANLREAESAKVSALEDLLEPLLEEGHKVLVFSQFVTMLDLLRENVKQRGWPHFYLAGETENRGELVRKFQSAKDGAVFLISLKAGGFGLNLTAASYVVLFDPWWNPAVENQAIDRTHRIGQSSKVMAYRLLVRDSVEQKIRALQKHKAALADDVLGEERFAQSLTREDLQFLFADGTGDSNKSVREFTDGDFHLGQRVGRSSSQNRKPAAEPCGNGGSTGVYSDDRGV